MKDYEFSGKDYIVGQFTWEYYGRRNKALANEEILQFEDNFEKKEIYPVRINLITGNKIDRRSYEVIKHSSHYPDYEFFETEIIG